MVDKLVPVVVSTLMVDKMVVLALMSIVSSIGSKVDWLLSVLMFYFVLIFPTNKLPFLENPLLPVYLTSWGRGERERGIFIKLENTSKSVVEFRWLFATFCEWLSVIQGMLTHKKLRKVHQYNSRKLILTCSLKYRVCAVEINFKTLLILNDLNFCLFKNQPSTRVPFPTCRKNQENNYSDSWKWLLLLPSKSTCCVPAIQPDSPDVAVLVALRAAQKIDRICRMKQQQSYGCPIMPFKILQ